MLNEDGEVAPAQGITTQDIADYAPKLGTKPRFKRNKYMPNAVVKSYAQKSGKSMKEVEDEWKSVEKSVRADKKYKGYDEKKIYAIINGIVKKNSGIKESDSFLTKIKSYLQEVSVGETNGEKSNDEYYRDYGDLISHLKKDPETSKGKIEFKEKNGKKVLHYTDPSKKRSVSFWKNNGKYKFDDKDADNPKGSEYNDKDSFSTAHPEESLKIVKSQKPKSSSRPMGSRPQDRDDDSYENKRNRRDRDDEDYERRSYKNY